jgi:hypothetical protein
MTVRLNACICQTRHADQDTLDSDKASSDTPRKTQASEASDKPTPTASGDKKKDDDASSTAKETGSGTAKGSGTKTTGKPKTTSFDPRLPAGGITMVTPDALAGSQFYKVGDWVTFAWNYTSVSVMPTAIDVLASCTANQATYTIAVNMSAKQTEVLWDTANTPDGQAPFLTENYKLMIYDSDLSATAAPRAGYLGAFSAFTFGMYTPQPRVDLKGMQSLNSALSAYPLTSVPDYECATCNGALSHFEKMTLMTMFLTTGTTVGSLLYFTYQFGLW